MILSRKQTTTVLIRLRRCAGWSAPFLFAYGFFRFSHDVVQILIYLETAHKCFYLAPTRGFWLGMTKRTHSQVYSWSDLSKPSFTLWAKGQPKNFASSKSSCCAMFLQTGTWNDGFCTDLLSGLVCKKPKSQISTTPMSPFKVGCPEVPLSFYKYVRAKL